MGNRTVKASKTKVSKKNPSNRFAKLRRFVEKIKINPNKRPCITAAQITILMNNSIKNASLLCLIIHKYRKGFLFTFYYNLSNKGFGSFIEDWLQDHLFMYKQQFVFFPANPNARSPLYTTSS